VELGFRRWQHGDHAYAVSGTYVVTLTVMDNNGAEDSASQQVVLVDTGGNASPVAGFSYNCSARTCMFDSSGSTDDAGIVSWSWNFGDGSNYSSSPMRKVRLIAPAPPSA
jgi:PKD repeat protein